MARAKLKSLSARGPARKAAARRSPKASARAKARPVHKFLVKKFRPQDFKSDGLRAYAQYRDLGVKDATRGMVVAHVIRLVGSCDPKVVSKEHLHDTEFQM